MVVYNSSGQDCSSSSPCGCHLYSPPSLPQLHLIAPAHSIERHHPFRQEHHLSQGNGMVHGRWYRSSHPCSHGQFLQTCHGCVTHNRRTCRCFPRCQLRHWPWRHGLDYDSCFWHHGFLCQGKGPQGDFREVLVFPPPFHCLFHLLATPRHVLHDQA